MILTSPQQIWVPPDSTTGMEKAYFDKTFNPFYRIEQVRGERRRMLVLLEVYAVAVWL